jgi:hypothetical protein
MVWILITIAWLYAWGGLMAYAAMRVQTNGSVAAHAFCGITWPITFPCAAAVVIWRARREGVG